MSKGKVLLGVLAGVATGATLGILFAPDKGSKTRKKIYKKGADSMDDVKDKFEELVDNFSSKFEAVKERMNMLSKNSKSKLKETKAEIKATMG